MAKILITGDRGFIGRNLVEYMVDKFDHNKNHQHSINILGQTRLEDFDKLKTLVQEINPEVIFHLAGIPIVKKDENNPSKIIRSNIEGTLNLLEVAPQDCKFVFASTVTTYGDLRNSRKNDEFDKCEPTSNG